MGLSGYSWEHQDGQVRAAQLNWEHWDRFLCCFQILHIYADLNHTPDQQVHLDRLLGQEKIHLDMKCMLSHHYMVN